MFPASQISDLERLQQQLNEETERLDRVNTDINSLISELGWKQGFALAIGEASGVVTAIPMLLAAKAYNGNWADPAIRGCVKKQIESVLLDLAEAQELRMKLESRFSHRAFVPAARATVEKGKRFASWWTRLFGSYHKYRMEIADLYKTAVPETKALLGDIQQLAVFHNRMKEVGTVYEQLKHLLLPAVIADQIESWQTALVAINAFEGFIAAAPQVASFIPCQAVAIDVSPNDPRVSRLLEVLQYNVADTSLFANYTATIANMGSAEASKVASELQLAACHCASAIKASQTKFRATSDMEQLLRDIELAQSYAHQVEAVEAIFKARVPDLPENAQPFQSDGWHAAIRGVESAEKLLRIFGSSPVMKEIACTPGLIDNEILRTLCRATESAVQQVSRLWSKEIAFIKLAFPGEQEVEPRTRIASELKRCAMAAASEFESISARLSKLIAILKPGHSVALDRLPRDAKAIEQLRLTQDAIDQYTSLLSQLGIDHSFELRDDECQVCEWIERASDDLLNSALTRAVATCPRRRTQVAEILARAKRSAEQMSESWVFLEKIFDPTECVSTGFVPKDLTLREFPAIFKSLILATDSIDEWIQFNRWRDLMSETGLAAVVDELINGDYSPNEVVDAVCAKLYQQLFDHFVPRLRHIGDFDGVRHEQIREQYRALDEWEIKAAAARVREFQLNREDRPRVGWLAPVTSELGILKRETEKKRRHMPLRKLFHAIPSVLQRLKPCIMMSPLSVSTFLQADTIRFDLVIFDEASQVFPWDAIGAIYRGSQLIVAGDDKQLPPTSFFSRADIESEEEEVDIGDFESILSLCKSVNMPNKRLRWHYRSRREPLIAFSNKHFYEGDLVTFPSVRDAARDAVQLIHVPNGLWSDRKNLTEARKVAELVVQHFQSKPEKSLGVIAFNATQQQAIEDAIYDLRRSSPSTDALLKERTHEPLFIKNLENVQGDERDEIILSFGYGRNEAGKFIKNFGPLSKPGGERRLNVAVTRAREAVSLVASVRSSDMDLSESTSVGARLLKAYLEYAEHGVDSISRSVVETQGICESPFEEEVAEALIRRGLEPVSQVGCGGYRIDLALKHPGYPGLYCLGIECDGATYHSSKTARDRDRIRQSILESLGWRICRVWSTDWVRNPEIQIQRILSMYNHVAAIRPEPDQMPPRGPNLNSKIFSLSMLPLTIRKLQPI